MTSSIELARGIYESFSAGEPEAFAALCTPDMTWIQNEGFPYGGRHEGPQAVLDGVRGVLSERWEGFRFVPEESYEHGPAAIFVGRYVGRHRETGAPIDAATVHVLEFRSGLLHRFRQYTDTKVVHDATIKSR